MNDIKKSIKDLLITILSKDFPNVQNIENLIEVKECKNRKNGDYCVSLHKFANRLSNGQNQNNDC